MSAQALSTARSTSLGALKHHNLREVATVEKVCVDDHLALSKTCTLRQFQSATAHAAKRMCHCLSYLCLAVCERRKPCRLDEPRAESDKPNFTPNYIWKPTSKNNVAAGFHGWTKVTSIVLHKRRPMLFHHVIPGVQPSTKSKPQKTRCLLGMILS